MSEELALVRASSIPRVVWRSKEILASKLAIAAHCPLRYLLETESLVDPPLAESIASLLGTIVHETKDRLMRDPLTLHGDALRRHVSQELIHAVSEMVGACQVIDALGIPASIANLVSFEDLLDKLRLARRIGLEGHTGRGEKGSQQYCASTSDRPRQKTFGPEVPLSSSSLDLKGRADIIERGENCIRITEFKTGRALKNGEPTVATLLQVCAYALMQAERMPTVPIIVRIVDPNGEWKRTFSSDLAKESLAALRTIAKSIPRDRPLTATDVARPGVVCRACRFRPDCSAYRTWVESQWVKPDAQLPLDTWGEIIDIARIDERLSDVRLLDATRRHVRISNVPHLAFASHVTGAWLEAYALTSMEVGRGNAHPCNFQVVDRRRPYRSAYSARVWVQAAVPRP